ncbi:MAG TPA: hypothetical protein VF488_08110, partial [Gemmatimonadaceae bacterium]
MRDPDPGRAAREITAAITALLDTDSVAAASASIARVLANSGVTFEGRTVRVSLFPSVFDAGDVAQIERRTLPEIGLMRYDLIIEAPGVWSVLETNTACPGATIRCSRPPRISSSRRKRWPRPWPPATSAARWRASP